jgi:uncharacterized protein YqjF (DUF2071 family)
MPALAIAPTQATQSGPASALARREMESLPGEPFWLCDWTGIVFIHFETDAAVLQRQVPFPLDLFESRAFVSLVAFTLADMRPRFGGRFTQALFRPFGTHRFLNVRTYVRPDDRPGIYFLAEWLDAPRLNLFLGPFLYGLPFRCGRLEFRNAATDGTVHGQITDTAGRLTYQGRVDGDPRPALAGSVDEFLVERYRAYTNRGHRRACFPVWHPPWEIAPATLKLIETTLLTATGDWFTTATFHSAHWSSAAGGVWMGWRRTMQAGR